MNLPSLRIGGFFWSFRWLLDNSVVAKGTRYDLRQLVSPELMLGIYSGKEPCASSEDLPSCPI